MPEEVPLSRDLTASGDVTAPIITLNILQSYGMEDSSNHRKRGNRSTSCRAETYGSAPIGCAAMSVATAFAKSSGLQGSLFQNHQSQYQNCLYTTQQHLN